MLGDDVDAVDALETAAHGQGWRLAGDRTARLQVVTDTGAAHLLVTRDPPVVAARDLLLSDDAGDELVEERDGLVEGGRGVGVVSGQQGVVPFP